MRTFFSSLLFFLAGAAIGIWLWSYARQAADQKHDEETFAREQQAAPVPSPAPSPKATKAKIPDSSEFDLETTWILSSVWEILTFLNTVSVIKSSLLDILVTITVE